MFHVVLPVILPNSDIPASQKIYEDKKNALEYVVEYVIRS